MLTQRCSNELLTLPSENEDCDFFGILSPVPLKPLHLCFQSPSFHILSVSLIKHNGGAALGCLQVTQRAVGSSCVQLAAASARNQWTPGSACVQRAIGGACAQRAAGSACDGAQRAI